MMRRPAIVGAARRPAQSGAPPACRSTRRRGPARRSAASRSRCATNSSRRVTRACRNSTGPLNLVPSGSAPDASIGLPSTRRRSSPSCPCASKFSSAKPSGSIRAWQRRARPGSCGAARAVRAPSSASPLSSFSRSGGHVGRRRRRRRAEEVFEQPLAANHRRRAVRVGRHRQDAARAPAGRPGASSVSGDAPEVTAVHVRNAVVPRQPLVDEGVVRRQQVADAAVLPQLALEEQLASPRATPARRLSSNSGNSSGSGDACCRFRSHSHWPAKLLDERLRARIGQHAPRPAARARADRSASPFGHLAAARRPECCSTGRTTAATPARDRSAGTAPGAGWLADARPGTGSRAGRAALRAPTGCRSRSRPSPAAPGKAQQRLDVAVGIGRR